MGPPPKPPQPVRRSVPGRDRLLRPHQSLCSLLLLHQLQLRRPQRIQRHQLDEQKPKQLRSSRCCQLYNTCDAICANGSQPWAANVFGVLGVGMVTPTTNDRYLVFLSSLRNRPGTCQSTQPSTSSAAVSYTHGRNMVFVELCCGRNLCLRQACMEVGVSYIGCHDCLQGKAVQREIIKLISSVCQGRKMPEARHRSERGTKIHVHVSLPCTGGSPILNFHQQSRVEVFEEIANSVDCLLKKVDEALGQVSKSLELQYWKSEVLRKVLSNQRLEFEGIVNRCLPRVNNQSERGSGLCRTGKKLQIG